jgi:hypothetical protein
MLVRASSSTKSSRKVSFAGSWSVANNGLIEPLAQANNLAGFIVDDHLENGRFLVLEKKCLDHWVREHGRQSRTRLIELIKHGDELLKTSGNERVFY